MSKASILNKLSFTTKPAAVAFSPSLHRRSKLIERLQEQREMARCMLSNETFAATKQKTIDNAQTGQKEKVTLPKRVKPWYYCIQGAWYFEIRYGNTPLTVSKGKEVLLVGEQQKELLTVIDAVIAAANAGELDELLLAIKRPTKKAG